MPNMFTFMKELAFNFINICIYEFEFNFIYICIYKFPPNQCHNTLYDRFDVV